MKVTDLKGKTIGTSVYGGYTNNIPALQKVFDYLLDTKEISKRLDARALTDLRYHPKAPR